MTDDRDDIPTSYAGPYLSVLASPHLLDLPEKHLEWLKDRLGEIGWAAVVKAKS